MTDQDRDQRIAELLDERRRAESTLRDADTLRQLHPDVVQEVLRLAQTEESLLRAAQDWNAAAGDETVSAPAFSGSNDTPDDRLPGLPIGERSPEQIGRYRIVRVLGEGGMGTVYAADDPQLHRRVAIKVPHFFGSPAKQEQARRRFLREARSAAAIEHPNVCPIYDVGEHEQRPYVVMALIEGETLSSWRTAQPTLDPENAARLILKVAAGLAAVHAHGIIHRDLKPGNILLRSKDGEPILTDFGLAQLDDDESLTGEGVIVGTPAYMAPEQADPTLASVGPPSDVYSLGVILFELLTRRRPFEGDAMQIVSQLVSRQAPRPSQFRSKLSPALDTICAKAMARNPAERFLTVEAFAQALAGWLNDPQAPTITFADTRSAVDARPLHRRRQFVGIVLSVTAASIMVLAAIIAYWMRSDSRSKVVAKGPPDVNVAGGDKVAVPPDQLPAPAEKLRGVIDVLTWRKDEFDEDKSVLQHAGRPLRESAALPLAPGDWLRIEVTLNRPAYCYVLWIDTEGLVSPIHPWRQADWNRRPPAEEPTSLLRIPPGPTEVAPLGRGPAGMETLLLLARDEPLPPDADLPKLIGPLTAQKGVDPRSAVWFENGKVVTDELHRGPIRLDLAQSAVHPVIQTQAHIHERLRGLFFFSRAVSFSNRGDK